MLLPHRYPFLMVDRVVEITDGRAVTLKNVTHNEPFFNGHFPGDAGDARGADPGSAGAIRGDSWPTTCWASGRPFFMLTGLDKVRFRRRVVPGDQLRMEVRLLRQHRPLWKMHAEAQVDGELAAQAEVSAMEVEEKIR